jgi:hypothetical protein
LKKGKIFWLSELASRKCYTKDYSKGILTNSYSIKLIFKATGKNKAEKGGSTR